MLNQPGIVGDGVLETKVPHSHGRHHSRSVDSWRRLSIVLGLTTLYMIAEVIGGWWTGSLALLADAGHMFTDAAALVLQSPQCYSPRDRQHQRRLLGITGLRSLLSSTALRW